MSAVPTLPSSSFPGPRSVESVADDVSRNDFFVQRTLECVGELSLAQPPGIGVRKESRPMSKAKNIGRI